MKRFSLGAVLAALTVAAACGDESGPVAGDLVVSASTAPTGARAVLLTVVGPVTAVAAPDGAPQRVFSSTTGDTTRIAVIAPSGLTLGTGPLVEIAVPDTRRSAQYTATAVQASNASHQLIGPAFTFTVVKP